MLLDQGPHVKDNRTTQVEERIAPLCPLIYPFLCNKVQLISLLSLGEETECAQHSNFSFQMREPGETLRQGRLCVQGGGQPIASSFIWFGLER